MSPRKILEWGLVVACGSTTICWIVGFPLNPYAVFAFSMVCAMAFLVD